MNRIIVPTTYKWKPESFRKETKGIVVHSMAKDINGDSPKFLNDRGLSAHAFIHPDGTIQQGQYDKYKAHHAGVSQWDDEVNLNDTYLGIELLVDVPATITGVSHDLYSRFLYTIDHHDWVMSPQFDSLVWLCKRWMKEFPTIKRENIISHSDCSGDDVRGEGKGKRDVGKMFDWNLFNKYIDGDGIFPV